MIPNFRWLVMDEIKNIDTSKPLNFYTQLLGKDRGKILEIGIKQPLLISSLVEKGRQIEGLVACKKNSDQISAPVYQAPLSNFKLPSLYEAVIIPFGCLLTISQRVEAIKALKCCYEHLKPNGVLLVDIVLQEEFELNVRQVETYFDKEQLLIFESQIVEVDFYEQKVVYLLSYEKRQGCEMVNSERKLQPFMWFGIKEFKLVLERLGYKNVEFYKNDHISHETTDHSKNKLFTFRATKQNH